MPGTILEYVKESCNKSFYEEPLNDVDSLALCQFAYLKFDGIVPVVGSNLPSVTMEEVANHADYEKLFADVRYEKDNRALFEGMYKSRRFHNLKMNCYINIIEKEWETQFSAITFILEDGTPFVAFRGTDETIVGWKEDFNMAFLSPVPGQAYSVKYLNTVTGQFGDKFYIGGHSKGGNLAVYSAMNCAPSVKERIIKIYSMDGPGFRPEVLETLDFKSIEDREVKILPHSSLVGMLFGNEKDYRVVESKTYGLAQHNPYTWIVEDGKFEEVPKLYAKSIRGANTINEWLLSLDETQLKTFSDTFYTVLTASDADNLIQLTADWKKSANGIIGAIHDVDPKTEEILKEIVKALFEIMRTRMKHFISKGLEQAEDTVKEVSKKMIPTKK